MSACCAVSASAGRSDLACDDAILKDCGSLVKMARARDADRSNYETHAATARAQAERSALP